jgi:hypothetical protein
MPDGYFKLDGELLTLHRVAAFIPVAVRGTEWVARVKLSSEGAQWG